MTYKTRNMHAETDHALHTVGINTLDYYWERLDEQFADLHETALAGRRPGLHCAEETAQGGERREERRT